jgi:hypothetical protein
MPTRKSPVQPADTESRALARRLIAAAGHGALAVLHPDSGVPHVSRIALAPARDGHLLAFLSAIALHSRALVAAPRAGLLVGEPGARGDPLAQPRLSLTVEAAFVPPDLARVEELRALWLARHPKARVYADLPDFRFVRLRLCEGLLNGGFGRAYALSAADLLPPQ